MTEAKVRSEAFGAKLDWQPPQPGGRRWPQKVGNAIRSMPGNKYTQRGARTPKRQRAGQQQQRRAQETYSTCLHRHYVDDMAAFSCLPSFGFYILFTSYHLLLPAACVFSGPKKQRQTQKPMPNQWQPWHLAISSLILLLAGSSMASFPRKWLGNGYLMIKFSWKMIRGLYLNYGNWSRTKQV